MVPIQRLRIKWVEGGRVGLSAHCLYIKNEAKLQRRAQRNVQTWEGSKIKVRVAPLDGEEIQMERSGIMVWSKLLVFSRWKELGKGWPSC